MKDTTIKDYLLQNPSYLTGNYSEVATKFGVSYDVVRKLARKLRDEAQAIQSVETPEGYKGVLKAGKMWQIHDGTWRESLQFEVDHSERYAKFKEEFLKEVSLLGVIQTTPIKLKKTNNQVCLEISTPDLHFGKGDITKSVELFNAAVLDLWTKAEVFGIDRVLLPIGNDAFNSEGKRRTTTGGTPQDDSCHWLESFKVYTTAMITAVNAISKHYPVDILVIPGNHDHERIFYAGEVLNAYFANNSNVNVDNTYSYRKYYEYGTNMLMFTHGDSEKYADIPLIMATEQPEMFARTTCREAHLGHFHKEMLNEYRGIKVRFLPSLCSTDDWHTKMGYDHYKSAQAFLWDKSKGFQGYFQYNV
jgi:hypothetical protein